MKGALIILPSFISVEEYHALGQRTPPDLSGHPRTCHHDGYSYAGNCTDVVDIATNVTALTREALRLPDRVTKEQLVQIVVGLKAVPDEAHRFPRGKWATIQHLESLLNNRGL